MLTKRTTPVPSIVLSPALHYLLMMGEDAPIRVHGWVALAMVPLGEMDRHLRETWAEHGAALTAEAQACGFEPAGVSARGPRGPAAKAWAKAFLAAQQY